MLNVANLDKQTIADEVYAFFRKWDEAKDGMYKVWDEIDQYRVATDSNQTLNAKGGFNHSTHLPDTLVIGNTLEALFESTLFPSSRWFEWKPYEAGAASLDVRKAIAAYTEHNHELKETRSEYDKMVENFIYKGNAFSHTFYQNTTDNAGAKTINVAPEDIVFNPAEPSFNAADKCIRQNEPEGSFAAWMTDDSFDKAVVKEILDGRKNAKNKRAGFAYNKDQHYLPLGFSSYGTYVQEGFVEVLWFYGDIYCEDTFELKTNQLIVVAEGKIVKWSEAESISGKSPFAHVPYNKMANNLWGTSPLAVIIGLNYMRNHRENAKSDALDKMIEPDKLFQGDVEVVYDDDTGSTTYLAPEGGGVQELQISNQIASFNPELDRLKHEALVAVGLPQEFMGFRTAGEKTFGEVASLADGAMKGFLHKAMRFERELLVPSLNMELELERKYMRGIVEAPFAEADGIISFLEISKDKIAKKGVIKAVGSSRYARNLKLLTTLTQLSNTQLFQIAAQDVDPHAVSRLLEDLTETSLDGIFKDNAMLYAQAEQQELMNQLQQNEAATLSQPSVMEQSLV